LRVDAEAAKAVGSIESAPVASVALSVASDATRVPVRGFGYLVPRGEGEVLLGCLFMSQLFAGRAPAGRALLTLLAAGRRKPADRVDDDQLIMALLAEVLMLACASRACLITRWPRGGAAQSRHPRLVRAMRAARFPRLAPGLSTVARGALVSARAAQRDGGRWPQGRCIFCKIVGEVATKIARPKRARP
jgi:protoporphyrinogen oxidase